MPSFGLSAENMELSPIYLAVVLQTADTQEGGVKNWKKITNIFLWMVQNMST